MVRRLTRRLEALRTSVEAWDGSNGAGRAAEDGRDEIAAVAKSFNQAADRAEALLSAHKTLLANASHELRSPLARLRMAAELFARDGGPRSSRDDQPRYRRAGRPGGGDPAGQPAGSRRADVGGASSETVDMLALVAEEAARAGVQVAPVDPAPGAFDVDGSPRLLRRMVRNLVENALKHGAPPVEIEVAAGGSRPRVVTIAVRDHGPGVPPELRERVFEPFFRPSGRSEDAGSWGLGLSLTRQIARSHGGEVACGVAPDGATIFTASLPMALQGGTIRRDLGAVTSGRGKPKWSRRL